MLAQVIKTDKCLFDTLTLQLVPKPELTLYSKLANGVSQYNMSGAYSFHLRHHLLLFA